MRCRMVVLALFVALPTLAADPPKPWPQKGDVVFVAAELAGFNPATVGGMKMPDVPAVEVCAPMTVKKVIPGAIVARDDAGNDRKLRGDWAQSLMRTASDCRQAVERHGARRVKASGGYVYDLVDTNG